MNKPVGEYILVKLIIEEKIGSLFVPTTVKGKDKQVGEVVALGDNFEFEVEVGDNVLFSPSNIHTNEDGHVIVAHRDILYSWK